MKKVLVVLLALPFLIGMSRLSTNAQEEQNATVEAVAAEAAPIVEAVMLASNDYEIDNAHSTLGFAIKHLQVGTTRGGFNDYVGKITFDPNDYSIFKADVTIQAKSIDTKNADRDKHLSGSDFFDVDKYPTITFKSSRLEKRGEAAAIVGDLTIKDVTKEITIPVQISGPVQNPFGGSAIGIAGFTNINRQDFNVTWNKTLDNGGFMVDNNVDLVIEIEAHKK